MRPSRWRQWPCRGQKDCAKIVGISADKQRDGIDFATIDTHFEQIKMID
jgi:hypothetical protein